MKKYLFLLTFSGIVGYSGRVDTSLSLREEQECSCSLLYNNSLPPEVHLFLENTEHNSPEYHELRTMYKDVLVLLKDIRNNKTFNANEKFLGTRTRILIKNAEEFKKTILKRFDKKTKKARILSYIGEGSVWALSLFAAYPWLTSSKAARRYFFLWTMSLIASHPLGQEIINLCYNKKNTDAFVTFYEKTIEYLKAILGANEQAISGN